MERAYRQRYNIMHMIDKTLPAHEHDYTEDFDLQLRTLPEVTAYDIFFYSIWN